MNYISLKEISEKDVGKEFYVIVQVRSIRQTSGPTVFELKDNSGVMRATAFSRAGERAFPKIIPGENIQALVNVKKRLNDIELEIVKYDKINQSVLTPVNLEKKPFLIHSENLEKLRKAFIEIAADINKAISDSRPIIIRHHDDTDGYTCGIALEKAIRSLIEELNQEKAYLYLTRSSSRTPYYDYIDALRDLNNHLSAKNRFDEKPPLILLCDLGSNSQSINSIKRLMMYGIDFIIIDHHKFDNENKELAKFFLNPHIHELGSDLNAGSLACELALFINPDIKDIKHLPALSGTADKSEGSDYEKYLKLSDYDKEHLKKWAIVIDHELYYVRFQENPSFLEDLFFPTEHNKKIIAQNYPEIEKGFSRIKKAAEKYVNITEMKHFKLLRINKENTVEYGEYASSKLPRITHELITGPRITMVENDDSISFRADGVEKFSMVKLLDMLKKKFNYALLNGGGHDNAGNISFNAASKEEIIKEILEYLKEL